MHGKATLILTDKDTGKVVKRVEEHNMLTNALSDIFNLPPQIAFDKGSRYIFNGFLPMYENVLKGLVLFSENIPENANDYMLGGKYSVLATAGDEYSGTDAMRGSFNASSSGEIENGYRFVWDFAPEKAVGTIKALSLTNRLLGNRGNLSLAGADSAYMINPSDLANSGYNSNVPLLSGSGAFFLQKGKGTFYSYGTGNLFIKIYKYKISSPLELKICDKTTPTLESETQIALAFNSGASNTSISYDVITERLYVISFTSVYVNNVSCFKLRYAVINPVTAEKETETDYITTNVPYYNFAKIAVYGGKMYLSAYDNSINVCSLSGVLERTINLGIAGFWGFVTLDGKLAVDCKLTSSGRRCLYVFDEPKEVLTQHASAYPPLATGEVKYPYCLASYSGVVYLQLRTDYLATINNLAAPLEKTDQHALQVRYEVTND